MAEEVQKNGIEKKRSTRILIIDDTPANLALLVEDLEVLGYMVLVAQEGEEGVSRARYSRPDLILLDVMMPGMDGYETCRRLKADIDTRDIPIIFMSALHETSDKIRGFDVGGVDYIAKPFELAEVRARIHTHLSLRRLRDELQVKNEALETSEQHYRQLVESTPDAVLIVCEGKVVFSNAAARTIYRVRDGDCLLGKPVLELVAPENRLDVGGAIGELERGEATYIARSAIKEKALAADGSQCEVDVIRLNYTYRGRPSIQMVVRDISERARLEYRLQYQATHDALTGLPNRVLLVDRLKQAIAQAERLQQKFVVCFVDLDGFKWINDSLGHEIGDLLLKEVARRMGAAVRGMDTVARLGGDEFVALILSGGIETGIDIAQRLLAAISEPVVIRDRCLMVTCSIGCSQYPRDGGTVGDLLRHADAAMYRAKREGRNNLQEFNARLHAQVDERVALEQALRYAIGRDQLRVHYQMQTRSRDGEIIGMEALLRWHHPQQGLVPPNRFIPVAEECGLITPITEWVLTRACRQNRIWQDQGLPAVPVGVNVSARLLQNPDRLETMVRHCLETSGLAPQYLELELTESLSMDSTAKIIPLMRRLKILGVKLAIDDFGTGYSNMWHLKRFPIDRIKLDGSFVKELTTEPRSLAIVDAIVGMSQKLGLKVIAEQTETFGQVRLLKNHGCDEVQGYYFAKPLPPEQCLALLRQKYLKRGELLRAERVAPALLVVHDNPEKRQRLVDELGGEGIVTAATVQGTFEALAGRDIAAVLVAQYLPDVDLLELLGRVRHLYPDTARILIAGNPDSEQALRAVEEGIVHRVFTDPWRRGDVREIAADYLQRAVEVST